MEGQRARRGEKKVVGVISKSHCTTPGAVNQIRKACQNGSLSYFCLNMDSLLWGTWRKRGSLAWELSYGPPNRIGYYPPKPFEAVGRYQHS
ncbi:Uncharacterized protein TCM_015341 [Theobroma cacao]|uniref:Uncharacterized protein n=1 Tax=Theobroma cacao TaxID=3641 RepID=A0A061G0S0_THECC|nr:Uncharacterized protein TCM_015341 [Theobroma cacao]